MEISFRPAIKYSVKIEQPFQLRIPVVVILLYGLNTETVCNNVGEL